MAILKEDLNSRVADYRGLAEKLALRISRTHRARHFGAEYEDLVQEGLIAVWQAMTRGIATPGAELLERRMLDYVRLMGAQLGARRDGAIPYEALLPLDDYTVGQASEA